jgi:hypothetical protein
MGSDTTGALDKNPSSNLTPKCPQKTECGQFRTFSQAQLLLSLYPKAGSHQNHKHTYQTKPPLVFSLTPELNGSMGLTSSGLMKWFVSHAFYAWATGSQYLYEMGSRPHVSRIYCSSLLDTDSAHANTILSHTCTPGENTCGQALASLPGPPCIPWQALHLGFQNQISATSCAPRTEEARPVGRLANFTWRPPPRSLLRAPPCSVWPGPNERDRCKCRSRGT